MINVIQTDKSISISSIAGQLIMELMAIFSPRLNEIVMGWLY